MQVEKNRDNPGNAMAHSTQSRDKLGNSVVYQGLS